MHDKGFVMPESALCEKERQVQNSLSILEGTVNRIRALADELDNRLTPVLQPSPPSACPPTPAADPRDGLVLIAARAIDLDMQLEKAGNVLSEILRRLEV